MQGLAYYYNFVLGLVMSLLEELIGNTINTVYFDLVTCLLCFVYGSGSVLDVFLFLNRMFFYLALNSVLLIL